MHSAPPPALTEEQRLVNEAQQKHNQEVEKFRKMAAKQEAVRLYEAGKQKAAPIFTKVSDNEASLAGQNPAPGGLATVQYAEMGEEGLFKREGKNDPFYIRAVRDPNTGAMRAYPVDIKRSDDKGFREFEIKETGLFHWEADYQKGLNACMDFLAQTQGQTKCHFEFDKPIKLLDDKEEERKRGSLGQFLDAIGASDPKRRAQRREAINRGRMRAYKDEIVETMKAAEKRGLSIDLGPNAMAFLQNEQYCSKENRDKIMEAKDRLERNELKTQMMIEKEGGSTRLNENKIRNLAQKAAASPSDPKKQTELLQGIKAAREDMEKSFALLDKVLSDPKPLENEPPMHKFRGLGQRFKDHFTKEWKERWDSPAKIVEDLRSVNIRTDENGVKVAVGAMENRQRLIDAMQESIEKLRKSLNEAKTKVEGEKQTLNTEKTTLGAEKAKLEKELAEAKQTYGDSPPQYVREMTGRIAAIDQRVTEINTSLATKDTDLSANSEMLKKLEEEEKKVSGKDGLKDMNNVDKLNEKFDKAKVQVEREHEKEHGHQLGKGG